MYRIVNGIGKAYGAYVLVTADRTRAFPAGIFMSSDFSMPCVDAPTFFAVTGRSARGVTIERGTITYDGRVIDGRCFFSPSRKKERIAVLPSS